MGYSVPGCEGGGRGGRRAVVVVGVVVCPPRRGGEGRPTLLVLPESIECLKSWGCSFQESPNVLSLGGASSKKSECLKFGDASAKNQRMY